MLVASDLRHRRLNLEDGLRRVVKHLEHHPYLLATAQHAVIGGFDDMGIADLDGRQRQCSHTDTIGLGIEVLIESKQTVIALIATVEATLIIVVVTLIIVTLFVVLTILRRTTLTAPCPSVVLITTLTTLLGILLIPLLLSPVGSRTYRCTYHSTTCHTDEGTYITTTPSA